MSKKIQDDEQVLQTFQSDSKHLLSLRTATQIKKATREAIQWFTNKNGSNLKRVNLSVVTRARRPVNTFHPGQMLTYRYDAEGFEKGTLPYFDASPLVIYLKHQKNGNMLGLNLHYLSPPVRARILGLLLKSKTGKMRHDSRMRITYKLVNEIAAYKPLQFAIKSYKPKRFKSKMFRINSIEWKHAIMLPMAHFVGASARKVWSENPHPK